MNTVTSKNQKAISQGFAFILFMIAGFFISNQLLAQNTDPKNPNSTLWKISGNGLEQPSYLFGTYHLINSGYLPSDGKVMKAFDSSDAVVVEMEVDSSQLGKIAGYSTMPGNSLARLLEKDEYAIVDAEVQTVTRQPLKMLDQLKPMSIMLFLTLTYTNDIAPDLLQYQGTPLDPFFVARGRSEGKSVHTFESMEEQMELLYNHLPLEEQADQLVEFVKGKKKVVEFSRELIELYKAENINEMEEISGKMADAYGGTEALLTERNEKWMKTLPGLLQSQSTFVAVGALHLPGEKGLINLLQKQGFTVEPVH